MYIMSDMFVIIIVFLFSVCLFILPILHLHLLHPADF